MDGVGSTAAPFFPTVGMHVAAADFNQTVDVIIVSDGDVHPIHLHGHKFWVSAGDNVGTKAPTVWGQCGDRGAGDVGTVVGARRLKAVV